MSYQAFVFVSHVDVPYWQPLGKVHDGREEAQRDLDAYTGHARTKITSLPSQPRAIKSPFV